MKPAVNTRLFFVGVFFILPSVCGHASEKAPKVSPPLDNSAAAELARSFIKPLFHVLDCEHVGVVEKGETDEHFHPLFFAHDLDHSRSIDKSEYFAAQVEKNPERDLEIFTLMDSDRDGRVSTMEFRLYVMRAIELADRDGNGELTALEVYGREGLDKQERQRQALVEKLKQKQQDKNIAGQAKPAATMP